MRRWNEKSALEHRKNGGWGLPRDKLKFMHFGTLETASFQIIWELCSSFYAEKERSSPNLFYLKFEDFVLANNASGPPLATSLTRQGKEVGINIKLLV